VTARVHFLPQGIRVELPAGATLLAAAQRARLPVARACGAAGLCARCGLRILRGAASLEPESAEEARAKRANRVDPELRLACRARVRGEVTATAPYW